MPYIHNNSNNYLLMSSIVTILLTISTLAVNLGNGKF